MVKQSGFTLIEVLVTVVVLAGGLLGLAAMQATGLKFNQSAYNRSQAIQLAYDMIDRMRANPKAADKYTVSSTQLAEKSCPITGGTSCGACLSSATACSPENMAKKDLYDFKETLNSLFPASSPQGSISLTSGNYTIQIRWDEDRNGALDDEDPNINLSFNL